MPKAFILLIAGELNMDKKNKLFWSVYVFMLTGIVMILDSVFLLKITSIAESVMITFFLLLIGFFFKKWFDGWYKSQ